MVASWLIIGLNKTQWYKVIQWEIFHSSFSRYRRNLEMARLSGTWVWHYKVVHSPIIKQGIVSPNKRSRCIEIIDKPVHCNTAWLF